MTIKLLPPVTPLYFCFLHFFEAFFFFFRQKHVTRQNLIPVEHTTSTKKAYNCLVRLLQHTALLFGEGAIFLLCMPMVGSYCSVRLEAYLRGKISPPGKGLSI